MFESMIQNGYWYMFMQVVVTLLLLPIYSFKRLSDSTNAYCESFYPVAKSDMQRYKAQRAKVLFAVTLVCFLVAFSIVLHANIHAIELFNWDNQAGLLILFLIAMIPVITIVLIQKRMFSLLKKYADGKRTASLHQQKWQDYFSIPMFLILVGGQFLFVGTVSYFVNHPFDGFAGYGNLVGLLIVNAIFVAICYATFNSKLMATIKLPEQRVAIKVKAVKVIMIIWIVAVYQLSASMWISGLELKQLNLFTQSLYIQFTVFLTAYSTVLPKPSAAK